MKLIAIVATLLTWLTAFSSVVAADFMFRARVDGKMVEGKPLLWTAYHMKLLGRDGQVYEFDPRTVKEQKKTSPRFFGYSHSEVKGQLQKEFGKQFDVSETRHYLVVHPKGEKDEWANRFEDMYKRFEHYFRVRGFKLEEPPYPLVAVVFRNQADYLTHAKATGMDIDSDILGYFAHQSNRVFLYDSAKGESSDWSNSVNTIIHETTHQTAYNTGIHRRFSGAPKWVTEGLATMFEAPGVWNAQYDRTQADRINRGRLGDFKHYLLPKWQPGMLMNVISSDRMFDSDPSGAYAVAWALSFYLCETQPRLYSQYLAKTAERNMFTDYSAAERVSDFQDYFGSEMKMFETKFLRYIEEVKPGS